MIHDVCWRSQFFSHLVPFLVGVYWASHAHDCQVVSILVGGSSVGAPKNGGWQQQMQHFHDSSPLFGGNLSNGHPLASTVLLAAFALLIFIELAKKGTWTKFVTFLKSPAFFQALWYLGTPANSGKEFPTPNLLFKQGGWKVCFFSTKKALQDFNRKLSPQTKASPPALVGPSLRILVLFASLSLGAFLAIEVKTQVAVLFLGVSNWNHFFGRHEL